MGLAALAAAVATCLVPPPAAALRYVYVSNSGNDTVPGTTITPIRVGLGSSSQITVGQGPSGLAFTPDGRLLYVANNGTQGTGTTVSVVDTVARQTVATVPVGREPTAVAVAPDGRFAYVVCSGSEPADAGSVAVIDTTSQAVVSTIPFAVGSEPTGIAITPDGKKAYVTQQGTDDVAVVDLAANTVTRTIWLGDDDGDPGFLQVTPDGSRAYVPLAETDEVAVVNVSTDMLKKRVPLEAGAAPIAVAITPDGKLAYVPSAVAASSAGRVYVISTETDAVVLSPISVGSDPVGAAVTPDGSKAFVANNEADTVSIISTSEQKVTDTLTGFDGPLLLAAQPNQGPSATFRALESGRTLRFETTASDPHGKVAQYDWDFGDGATMHYTDPRVRVSHTYERKGTYTVTLRVTDDEGTSTGPTIYTGQSYLSVGSPRAVFTRTLDVDKPWVSQWHHPRGGVVVKMAKPLAGYGYRRHKFRSARGTASGTFGVSEVMFAVARRTASSSGPRGGKRHRRYCQFVRANGKIDRKKGTCHPSSFLPAQGTTSWTAQLPRLLPPGRYVFFARAKDPEGGESDTERVNFHVVSGSRTGR